MAKSDSQLLSNEVDSSCSAFFFELNDPFAIGLLPISKAVCAGSSRLFPGKKDTNPETLDARRCSNSICLFLVLSSAYLPSHTLQLHCTLFLIFVDIITFLEQKHLMKILQSSV